MPRRYVSWILVVAFTSIMTACDSGSTAKTTSETTPPATTTAPPMTSHPPLKPRPSIISVQNADPCAWFNPKDHPKLKIDTVGNPHDDDSNLKAKECVWNVNGADYRLSASITKGVDYWLTPTTEIQTTIGEVEGFPAIRIIHKVIQRCDVAVDVAPGQQIFGSATITKGWENKFPPNCESAEMLATSAMKALLANR